MQQAPRLATGPYSAGSPSERTYAPPGDIRSRATLPITVLIQATASAATIAPAVAAPRLVETMGIGMAAVGIYIAVIYLGAAFSSQ